MHCFSFKVNNKEKKTTSGNSLKRALAALQRGRFSGAARHLLKISKFRSAVEQLVGKMVWHESRKILSSKLKSGLQMKNDNELETVQLQNIAKELKKNAPLTYSILGAIIKRKYGDKESKKAQIRVAVAFSLLINHRNQNINTVQKLLGVLLYKAKARVKV